MFVYILRSKRDGNLYIGKTEDVERRVGEHNAGYVVATGERRPLELVAYFKFLDRRRADSFERYLKTGSGRAFLKRHVV
ncbi:MAG: GIY-YIG nuclease family protein [Deltaproteobacteria bacterium]|nr:GIY-YIG nuclease family protein [Deltaproteobacteria bacterium]